MLKDTRICEKLCFSIQSWMVILFRMLCLPKLRLDLMPLLLTLLKVGFVLMDLDCRLELKTFVQIIPYYKDDKSIHFEVNICILYFEVGNDVYLM